MSSRANLSPRMTDTLRKSRSAGATAALEAIDYKVRPLFPLQFQVDGGGPLGIEHAEPLGRAGVAVMLGFQFVVHVGAESGKMIGAVSFGDEGPDLQSLGVF